jgi:aldehyde dehydrogenase (NAD+)
MKGIFINGVWAAPSGTDTIAVVDPTTEAEIGAVAAGTAADVDHAVVAARRAFDDWSRRPVAERAELLARLAAAIGSEQATLADIISRELGAPRRQSEMIQVGLPIYEVQEIAKLARDFVFEELVRNSLVVHEPIGVVAAITPWNFPLHQITAKIAPALVSGCTVVVKPSEVTPLAALRLAELAKDAGFPDGVFNLVTGFGPVVGEALASHPDVDMVSFTGSTRAGQRVGELAARTVKRVALELGGKSPNVILDDADLATAVTTGVKRAFMNGGQACNALTRMLVPRSLLADAEELAVAQAERHTMGDPFDSKTVLGPLVSSQQRDRVRVYIETGVAEGAKLLTGGAKPPDGQPVGYFVRPTVFSGVDPKATIAQEEIFGPVLSILSYDNDDEAIAIANDSRYGLAAAVWSSDADRADAVARRLRVGQVEVNAGAFNAIAPFGGYKQSGNGREGGKFGIAEYLETKAMQR